MNRLLKKYLPLCLTATLTALLAACSDELPGDNNNNGLPKGWSRIELVLSAEPDPTTRAWDDKFATDKEMMKDALVVMVKNATESNTADTVKRIIPVSMDQQIWHERHNVATIATENGNYTFYSFGNITYTSGTSPEGKDMATINGITLTVDSPVPDELETSTWKAVYNNYNPSKDNLIPMTNKEEHPVNSTRTITLHLFRMLAKINFEFTNKTDKNISIQEITLNELTPNLTPIFFLPPKQGENIVNDFPDDTFHNAPWTFLQAANAFDVAPTKSASRSFYLNESASQHATGQMPLTIKMQRDGKEAEERFALMRLAGIARNDNVFVPITLTQYEMELKAFAYAPIGGYPPYTLTTNENEFYCTFNLGGDFALRPFIYKVEDKDHEENWFQLTDASKVAGYTLTYADPNNIFTTAPRFDGGEIRGTLKTATPPFKGSASVDLKVMLKTGTDGSVLQEYNRTLYIILNQK